MILSSKSEIRNEFETVVTRLLGGTSPPDRVSKLLWRLLISAQTPKRIQ
jgi:hypothetical protein